MLILGTTSVRAQGQGRGGLWLGRGHHLSCIVSRHGDAQLSRADHEALCQSFQSFGTSCETSSDWWAPFDLEDQHIMKISYRPFELRGNTR